jgi:hypothetical protein
LDEKDLNIPWFAEDAITRFGYVAASQQVASRLAAAVL